MADRVDLKKLEQAFKGALEIEHPGYVFTVNAIPKKEKKKIQEDKRITG